ncbi:ABC transporter permease [Brevibacillus sp. B_LB10_24]|uniref:ABC transporter permease n=1 Tax=Brevibacillus sp. B_LB10_24 TaxID=3380645 RepID=UPI0038BCE728
MGALELNADKVELSSLKHSLKKQQRRLFMRRFWSNRLMVTGSVIIAILLIVAIAGPALAPYDPYEMEPANRLQPPSGEHLLGTDNFGRDLFTRIVFGAQVSMGVGFAVAVIASSIGLVVGLYASYYRTLDQILMRICDGLMAIPGILLAIALVAALGPRLENVIIALSVVFIPSIARVVRSAALVVREETYIEAMKAQGASTARIIWLHIAPNTLSPLVVQATFVFADAIITEAALSFLGAGVPTPDPSWGNILYDGKLVIFKGWWMTVFPGILLILTVMGLNFCGDGVRDLIDPHASQSGKRKT